ncbi:winged helix-turn-helix transcriptional regulator [Pseudooceanicola sp.]|uniref:winged helix-turn-helix transcriptional regulator n=1 Tax=Pseudooceanicola sp. TaxID=1914328 RepID=UPI0035C76B55
MAKQNSENWFGCPIRFAATVLGDAWALLILRDLIFRGSRHFGDFVAGGERISTNILTDRLQRLEVEGVITRRQDPAHAKRVVYELTEKGRDLVPVLLAMVAWSRKWDARHEVPDAFAEALRDRPEAFAAAIMQSLEQGPSLEA